MLTELLEAHRQETERCRAGERQQVGRAAYLAWRERLPWRVLPRAWREALFPIAGRRFAQDFADVWTEWWRANRPKPQMIDVERLVGGGAYFPLWLDPLEVPAPIDPAALERFCELWRDPESSEIAVARAQAHQAQLLRRTRERLLRDAKAHGNATQERKRVGQSLARKDQESTDALSGLLIGPPPRQRTHG